MIRNYFINLNQEEKLIKFNSFFETLNTVENSFKDNINYSFLSMTQAKQNINLDSFIQAERDLCRFEAEFSILNSLKHKHLSFLQYINVKDVNVIIPEYEKSITSFLDALKKSLISKDILSLFSDFNL